MKKNINFTVDYVNRLAQDPEGFLKECTESYHNKVDEAAETVFKDNNKKIIMLAGPSSSGKTTTASILSEKLEKRGAKAYSVSLDNFYLPRSENYPVDEFGRIDYESVDALDIELIHSCIKELAECGKTVLPSFDFKSGERNNKAREITLYTDDVIIIEGLHALNPIITDTLNANNVYKIYASVSSRITKDNNDVLLSKRELRFIRRMVRDFSFRSMEVDRTFEIWDSVRRGEDKYLFPFEHLADIKLDSFHACEPCIFCGKAVPLLAETVKEHREQANALCEKLELFNKIDFSLLPQRSLLREFTG